MARLTCGERLDNFQAALDHARQSEDSERSIIELITDQAFDSASRSSALAALADTQGSFGSDLLRRVLRSALEDYAPPPGRRDSTTSTSLARASALWSAAKDRRLRQNTWELIATPTTRSMTPG
jgi:hypothetical protein